MSPSIESLNDNQLAFLAASGRQDAFGLLYDRHCRGVARALAPFAACDRDEIDDLIQEVFIRVIRGLTRYRPDKPFASWLYTVALNVGRNHLRARAKIKRGCGPDIWWFQRQPLARARENQAGGSR